MAIKLPKNKHVKPLGKRLHGFRKNSTTEEKMCGLSQNASMRCKSFIFGNLALAGSWVLFTLALLAAAWLPAKLIESRTIFLWYCLIITVFWAFYFITYMGSWVQSRYADKPVRQWLYLTGATAIITLALICCVWALPVLLITMPLLFCSNRSGKTALLGVVAGIGEFAALCSTVLLALLLKALLLGEWAFEGSSFRCDMVLLICGVLAIAGLLARGKMLANGEWTLKSVLRKPATVIIWSITVISVVATIAADKMQEQILENTKAEAEKVFAGELSASGMEKFYVAGRVVDAGFYNELNTLANKVNQAMFFKRSKGEGEGKKFVKPTAEDLKKRSAAFAANAKDYAALNKLIAGDIPAYPITFADGNLLELKEPQARIIRSAAFALMTQMRYDSKNILEYSKLYFKLINSLNGTSSVTLLQTKQIKFWCKTVEMLKAGKKISDEQFKALQALAKAEAKNFNRDDLLQKLAYTEAIFAYDLYRVHSLTTISATGAYFKYDRTEALRSLIDYAKTGKLTAPQRGVAKKLTVPFEIYADQFSEIRSTLNEL